MIHEMSGEAGIVVTEVVVDVEVETEMMIDEVVVVEVWIHLVIWATWEI